MYTAEREDKIWILWAMWLSLRGVQTSQERNPTTALDTLSTVSPNERFFTKLTLSRFCLRAIQLYKIA